MMLFNKTSPANSPVAGPRKTIKYNPKLAVTRQDVNQYDKEAVRAALPIEAVLNRYGLEPNQQGFYSCPWHKEKTPSARIFKEKLHCFGCGQSSDIFGLVQTLEGCDFVCALATCAELAGLAPADHLDLKEALARRERLKAIEDARKTASSAKYAALAAIGRNTRINGTSWLPAVDDLLEECLRAVPDAADLRGLALAAHGGNVEWLKHHLRRLLWEVQND